MHAQYACRCLRQRTTARITCCSIKLTLCAAEGVVFGAKIHQQSKFRVPSVLKSVIATVQAAVLLQQDMGCLRLTHACYRCDG